MDFTWRCNSLRCRTQLHHRAVVTTCSHIFCERCAEAHLLGESSRSSIHNQRQSGRGSTTIVRICPACHTQLQNPDDAVVTNLNPAEDYKTSVLSGLNPSVIMECAGRGLSFYGYQVTQEVMYQEHLARRLTDKYNKQSSELDKLVHDANSEIQALHNQLASMHTEKNALEKKNRDLIEALQEKARAHHQVQKLYNQLKQRQMAAGVQLAMDRDADQLLVGEAHSGSDRSRRNEENRLNTGFVPRLHARAGGRGGDRRMSTAWENHFQGDHRGGIGTPHNLSVNATPSRHRERLPSANLFGSQNFGERAPSVVDTLRQGTPVRQPLAELNPNAHNFGLSAGVKVGRQPGEPMRTIVTSGGNASGGVWGVR